VKSPFAWLPLLHGSDKYIDGKGYMLGKLFSIYPVINGRGIEMDQGGMLRYLNEIMWFPTAYLENNISWKPIDNNSAEVTLTDHGKSVSAVLYFDNEGRLTNFKAKRYYQSSGEKPSLEVWETPIIEYGEISGLKLPIKLKAVWKLKTGDYEYIYGTIKEIKFN
jgi:hypothetical protein